jgi:3-hydroxymyristoyl/3-hydroxydecanoyl-(acyl carrier protein) dehydratase
MALESWQAMPSIEKKSPDGLTAEFQIPPDSPWFSGHFPDEPILPGVAILSMAAGMVRRHERGRRNAVGLAGLKRVRFRLPVKPHDTVSMELTCEKADRVTSYRFQACVKEEIACTGVVLCEQADVG